jgi:hypothetical protein
MKKLFSLFLLCLGLLEPVIAQDSTETEAANVSKQKFARATFNATKLINMQTTEIVSPGALQFMISHHFGYLWNKDLGDNDGQRFRQNAANLFGLNSGIANTYLSFDYSPLKWANVGLAATGRAHFEGWTKFKLLRQQTGMHNIPVSVSLYSLGSASAAKKVSDTEFVANRFSFLHQLLIARKFSEKVSIQLIPTWIHHNLVPNGTPYGSKMSNETFSIGIGGKYKVRSKMNLTFEYARQLNMYDQILDKNGNYINYSPDLYAAGIEINTGGHLFQFYVGNTSDASAIDQLSRNTSDGKVALGFTINRSLNVKKEK